MSEVISATEQANSSTDIGQSQIDSLFQLVQKVSTLQTFFLEPNEATRQIVSAASMGDLLKHQMLSVEKHESDFFLLCLPCFQQSKRAHSLSSGLSVAEAHRLLNGKSSGNLATGQLITANEMASLLTGGDSFEKLRYSTACHIAGLTDKDHPNAAESYTNKKAYEARHYKRLKGLLLSALIAIDNPQGNRPFNSLIGLMSAVSADFGCESMDFVETDFLELCHLLTACLESRARDQLSRPLPSTGLPPMLSLACTMSCLNRCGAVALVQARCAQSGRAVAIPLESPELPVKRIVDSDKLANHLLTSLSSFKASLENVLSVSQEGWYDYGDFANCFRSLLKSDEQCSVLAAVSPDLAYYINEAVEQVRCSAGGFLDNYLDRATNFEYRHEFLCWNRMDCERQYFVCKLHQQASEIVEHYKHLHSAYRREREFSAGNKKLERDMFGYDFLLDTLCLLDLLGPIRALMEVATDGQVPHWKAGQLGPIVVNFLAKRSDQFQPDLYPRLMVNGASIRPGGCYADVPLLDGRRLRFGKSADSGLSDASVDSSDCGTETRSRSRDDVQADVTRFAGALRESLSRQLEAYSAAATPADAAAVMDAGAAVCLLASGDVAAEIEALAESPAAQRLLSAAIRHRGLAHLSSGSVASYVRAIHHAFIGGQGREGWTIPEVTGRISAVLTEPLQLGCDLKTRLKVTTEAGEVVSVVLNEAAIYRSMYKDPRVFVVAGREGCLLLDFALHLGSTQSFVESYGSIMRSQRRQQKRQKQESPALDQADLILRSKVRLLMPKSGTVENKAVLKDAVGMFFDEERRAELRKQRGGLKADTISEILDQSRQPARSSSWFSRSPSSSP